MINLLNVSDIDGKVCNLSLDSQTDVEIDANGLVYLPGLIDPHVHFRTPGLEYKEDWKTAAKAAIYGGYTTVFDMPNTLPPTITADLLTEKKALIDSQLKEIGIPLRYELFFGADKDHFSEIHRVKNKVIGIKVFMGCSTGNLVIDNDESLHAVFAIAAAQNMLIAVHAEDEARLHEQKAKFATPSTYDAHSKIRDVTAATIAVEKAIDLCRIYGTRLYILHVSTQDELALIAAAKKENLPVYAETTPHHLFLHDGMYETLKGKAVINPPLRAQQHNQALLEGIISGVIDTIGSDHAPHTPEEKARPYGQCPSGMPGIETTLPLLLNAHHEQLLPLKTIVALTSTHAQQIFNLPATNDDVLADLQQKRPVRAEQLKTKCAWSAFEGRELHGWPVYTVVNGQCFHLHR